MRLNELDFILQELERADKVRLNEARGKLVIRWRRADRLSLAVREDQASIATGQKEAKKKGW